MPRFPAVLALGLALAACTANAPASNIAVFEAAEREPAPELDAEDLLAEMPVADLVPGKPTVVNFWGSWCGPCREEQPLLQALHERLGDTVAFIGVNTRNDQVAAAKAFIEEFGVTYGSLYDPRSRIAIAFGVRVMPATFILDPQGRIAAQFIGAVRSAEDLERVIEEVSS